MFEQGFEIAVGLIMSVMENSEAINTAQWAELENEIEEEIDRYKHED